MVGPFRLFALWWGCKHRAEQDRNGNSDFELIQNTGLPWAKLPSTRAEIQQWEMLVVMAVQKDCQRNVIYNRAKEEARFLQPESGLFSQQALDARSLERVAAHCGLVVLVSWPGTSAVTVETSCDLIFTVARILSSLSNSSRWSTQVELLSGASSTPMANS